MGLGKVVGLGIAFIILLLATISGIIDGFAYAAQGAPILFLVGYYGAAAIFVLITYFVGRRFVRAVRQYRASRVGKPLQ
jgi:glucan phosphoethanolaminetransferase (alkaline phosphatase superfamily)